MFPLLRNRAARALDVAIEFATLGEYRLADPLAPGAPARGAHRRAEPAERREGAPARPAARGIAVAARGFAAGPGGGTIAPSRGVMPAAMRSAAPAARLVVPASAAGAARLRPVPVADEVAIKSLAREHHGIVASPPMRVRGGMAPPPAQPCDSPRR